MVKGLRNGSIKPDSLVAQEGHTGFRHACDVPEFKWSEIVKEAPVSGHKTDATSRTGCKEWLGCMGLLVVGVPALVIGFVLYAWAVGTITMIVARVASVAAICMLVGGLVVYILEGSVYLVAKLRGPTGTKIVLALKWAVFLIVFSGLGLLSFLSWTTFFHPDARGNRQTRPDDQLRETERAKSEVAVPVRSKVQWPTLRPMSMSANGVVGIGGRGLRTGDVVKGARIADIDWPSRTTVFEFGGETRVVSLGESTISGIYADNYVPPMLEPGRDITIFPHPAVPVDLVWVDALRGWVGKYEVQTGQFVIYPSGYHNPKAVNGRPQNTPYQPVTCVSYAQAVAFCESLSRYNTLPKGYRARLPTENEWTIFAQCGDGRKYPWGNDWPPKYGNYDDEDEIDSALIEGYTDGHVVTCPVADSGRNDWGLYGVGGNVWEWTTEATGTLVVARGASWDTQEQDCLHISAKRFLAPTFQGSDVGFRVVIMPE